MQQGTAQYKSLKFPLVRISQQFIHYAFSSNHVSRSTSCQFYKGSLKLQSALNIIAMWYISPHREGKHFRIAFPVDIVAFVSVHCYPTKSQKTFWLFYPEYCFQTVFFSFTWINYPLLEVDVPIAFLTFFFSVFSCLLLFASLFPL